MPPACSSFHSMLAPFSRKLMTSRTADSTAPLPLGEPCLRGAICAHALASLDHPVAEPVNSSLEEFDVGLHAVARSRFESRHNPTTESNRPKPTTTEGHHTPQPEPDRARCASTWCSLDASADAGPSGRYWFSRGGRKRPAAQRRASLDIRRVRPWYNGRSRLSIITPASWSVDKVCQLLAGLGRRMEVTCCVR